MANTLKPRQDGKSATQDVAASPAVAPSVSGGLVSDLPRLIERMHRRFLDVVRLEMSRHGVHDISPVQVMMISTIGNEEISVRDLIERGYYLGSNASYNLKNLVEGGYVDRQASTRDKRSARLKLSDKGRQVLARLRRLEHQLAEPLLTGDGQGEMDTAYRLLRKLERRWSDALRYSDGFGDDAF